MFLGPRSVLFRSARSKVVRRSHIGSDGAVDDYLDGLATRNRSGRNGRTMQLGRACPPVCGRGMSKRRYIRQSLARAPTAAPDFTIQPPPDHEAVDMRGLPQRADLKAAPVSAGSRGSRTV